MGGSRLEKYTILGGDNLSLWESFFPHTVPLKYFFLPPEDGPKVVGCITSSFHLPLSLFPRWRKGWESNASLLTASGHAPQLGRAGHTGQEYLKVPKDKQGQPRAAQTSTHETR